MQTNTLKMIVNSKIKKQILMCAPTYFEVTYAINPAMARTLACKIAVNQFKAMEQWTGLKDIYTKEGFDVVLIDPVKGLPDMVFTANCGIVNDGRAIIGEFKHAQRKPETEYFEKWFKENDYGIIHIKEEFEGTGDMLLWKDNIIGGHGVRSGLDGITKVAKFFTFLGRVRRTPIFPFFLCSEKNKKKLKKLEIKKNIFKAWYLCYNQVIIDSLQATTKHGVGQVSQEGI